MHLNIPIGGWKISHAVRGERMENQYTRPRHTHPSPCSLSEPRNLGLQLEGRDVETRTRIFRFLAQKPHEGPVGPRRNASGIEGRTHGCLDIKKTWATLEYAGTHTGSRAYSEVRSFGLSERGGL